MSGSRPDTGRALTVDWTRCVGRGLCIELLPELYERDPWGYPVATTGRPGTAEVPRRLEKVAGEAVVACPRMALRLEGAPEAAVSPSGRGRRTR